MFNIFNLFSRNKTTDQIMRPLTKIADRLDKHCMKQHRTADKALVKADAMKAKANTRRDEAFRASEARTKLNNFIG